MNNSVLGTHEPLKETIQNPTYTRLSFLTNRKLKCSVEGVRSTPPWSLLLVLVRFPRSPQPRLISPACPACTCGAEGRSPSPEEHLRPQPSPANFAAPSCCLLWS